MKIELCLKFNIGLQDCYFVLAYVHTVHFLDDTDQVNEAVMKQNPEV